MLFLRYENLKQYLKMYPITSFILIAQIVLYAWMEIVGSSTDPATLIRFGAMYVLPGESPEYWHFFASIFLHIGFNHLLFNSIAIFIFAPPLEVMLGKWNYIVYFLGCGFAGNVFSQMLHSDIHYSAGASGAIYGIYAAFLYLAIFRKGVLDQGTSSTIKIVLIIGVIHSLLVPKINLYAHLGGFVGGFVLFAIIMRLFYSKR